MTSPDGYHAKHSVLFTPGPPKTVEIGGVPETRTPTTIAMLKVPDETGHETDLHYVKSALMPGVSGAVYAQAEIFGIPDSWGLDASYFEDWHLADVSLDGSGGIVIARVNDLYGTRGSSGDPLPAAHRALQDLMNTYYGELNLRLIAAYSEELTVVDTAGETSVTVPDTALTADYALKSAYAGYLGDACAYKFDIAPLLDDGSKEDLTTYGAGKTAVGRSLNMGPPVGSDAGKFGSVQSLDGVKMLVELENVKMPDWGTADLAGIDVHIYYEGTWGSPGSDEVYSTRLPAVTSQIFEIPAGVSDKSGLYSIVMRAQSLAEWAGSGKSLIQTEVRAYVEKATVGSYGVVKATTVADAGSTTAQLEYDYPLDSSPALEVYQ